MAIKIQIRRDTAANWTTNNPILAEGEIALELDSGAEKTGNGISAWNDLAYKDNFLNVVNFGAKGDGETDEVDEINNALAYASLKNISVVMLEKGKIYRTSSFIYKPTNVSIDLNGSTIKLVDGLTEDEYPHVIVALDGNHNYTFIRNGVVDGNYQNSIAEWSLHGAGIGYTLYDSVSNPTSHTEGTHVLVENIKSTNTVRSCIVPGDYWKMDNIELSNTGYDHLLYMAGSKNVKIGNVFLTGFTFGVPVDFAGSNPAFNDTQPGGHYIENIRVESLTTNTASDIIRFRGEFVADGSGLITKAVKNVTINNVSVNSATGFAGIWTIGTSDGKCENITINNIVVDSAFPASGISLTTVEKSKNIKVLGRYVIRSCATTTNMFMVGGNANSIDSPDNIDISGSAYLSLNNQGNACISLNRNEQIRGLNANGVVYKNTNGSFLDFRDYQIYQPPLFDFKYSGIYFDSGDFFGSGINTAGITWNSNDNNQFGEDIYNLYQTTGGRILDSYKPGGVPKFTKEITTTGSIVYRSRGATQRDVMIIPFKENGHDIETSVIKIQTDEPLMTNGAKGSIWKLGKVKASGGVNVEIDGVEKVLTTEERLQTAIAFGQNHGNVTSDPSTGSIVIPHGIVDADGNPADPSYISVEFSDQTTVELSQYTKSVDATNITITFPSVPVATSVKVWWSAKL